MLAIARNTIKEIIRNKIFGIIALFAVLYLFATFALEFLTYTSAEKIIVDFGLAGITLFSILVAFFAGSSLLLREFEQQTILLLLSKPVSKSSFVIGKFLGLAFVLLLLQIGLAVVFFGILLIKQISLSLAFVQALLFTYVESLFVLSMILFFSVLVSPLIAIFCSLVLYMAGSTMAFVQEFLQRRDNSIVEATSYLYYVVPNFEIFHIADASSYHILLPWTSFGVTLLYGLVYSGVFLGLTILLLSHKEMA